MDANSEARLNTVHPELRRRLRKLAILCEANNLPALIVVQGLRLWSQQDALWAKGRTVPGEPCRHNGVVRPVGQCNVHPLGLTVTKARGGQSAHNFGYAGDCTPDDPNLPGFQPDWNDAHPAWGALLKLAKQCGLAEGAEWRSFPDKPHFYPEELPASPTDKMRTDIKSGGMEVVWRGLEQDYSLPTGEEAS